MRTFTAILVCFSLSFGATSTGKQAHPRPPGLRDGEKQINKPLDPPTATGPSAPDPRKLKREADELADLSAGIPARIALVSQGQLPKDLVDQLKRIEKLAKRLRSEIAP